MKILVQISFRTQYKRLYERSNVPMTEKRRVAVGVNKKRVNVCGWVWKESKIFVSVSNKPIGNENKKKWKVCPLVDTDWIRRRSQYLHGNNEWKNEQSYRSQDRNMCTSKGWIQVGRIGLKVSSYPPPLKKVSLVQWILPPCRITITLTKFVLERPKFDRRTE